MRDGNKRKRGNEGGGSRGWWVCWVVSNCEMTGMSLTPGRKGERERRETEYVAGAARERVNVHCAVLHAPFHASVTAGKRPCPSRSGEAAWLVGGPASCIAGPTLQCSTVGRRPQRP